MCHVLPVPDALEIPLRGPKGEPVDFARTIVSWCAAGAGRMLRAPTVFEDVVKTD
jgi:hypothetical protein